MTNALNIQASHVTIAKPRSAHVNWCQVLFLYPETNRAHTGLQSVEFDASHEFAVKRHSQVLLLLCLVVAVVVFFSFVGAFPRLLLLLCLVVVVVVFLFSFVRVCKCACFLKLKTRFLKIGGFLKLLFVHLMSRVAAGGCQCCQQCRSPRPR